MENIYRRYKGEGAIAVRKLEAASSVEENGEGDPVHVEENIEEVESNNIYVSQVFGDEENAYDDYSSHTLAKEFGIHINKTTKSRIDHKRLRKQFVCNKECKKLVTKGKMDRMCYICKI